MDAVGISALLGRRHFGLTVRILAQINVVCQGISGMFDKSASTWMARLPPSQKSPPRPRDGRVGDRLTRRFAPTNAG